jgi:alkylhydroperoxidase family enzyme
VKENRVMPRLKTVSRAEAPPDVLAIYDTLFPGGEPTDFWTTFALAPDILAIVHKGFGLLLTEDRELPAYLRELALVRTGLISGSRFVYSEHIKAARRVGIPDEKIAAIKGWATAGAGWAGAPLFTDDERVVLAFTDEVVLRNTLEDPTFAAARRFLNDQQILELIYLIALHYMYARVVRALRLESDDVPDRIIEVGAPPPAGQSAAPAADRPRPGSRRGRR